MTTEPLPNDPIMSLWFNAIASTVHSGFNTGPAIPFIQLGRFLELADKANFNVEGKRCMDYGCGQDRTFSIATLLYLLGSESVVVIDTLPPNDESILAKRVWYLLAVLALDTSALKLKSTYQNQIIKTRIFDFDLDALKQGCLYDGLPNSIKLYTGDYHNLAEEIGELDTIVSNSVFEHDPKIETTLKIFRKYLRQDGCIYTDIDYRDHRMYVSGLSPWQYLIDDSDVSPNYINKIRTTEMKNIIHNADFNIAALNQISTPPIQEVIDQFLPKYQKLHNHDINILQDTLLLK